MLKFTSSFLFILLMLSCASSQNKKEANVNNELNFTADYSLVSEEFGTRTFVTIENDTRIMKTNALPNHSTGNFPNSGNPNTISEQDVEYSFPLNPKFSGEAKWAREPGVALNGVKFEPGTAERFVCESGEVYRIEAFQDLVDLGLDFNHAHVQPTGAYHYHGVPTELVKSLDKGEDMIQIGYAHDGFPIYYSKSGKYKPSFKLSDESRTGDICAYTTRRSTIEKEMEGSSPDGTFVSDWVYEDGLGQLDECNGITVNGEYVYLVTDEYPYMGRCLKGEWTERRRPRQPRHLPHDAHPPGDRPPPRRTE